MRLRPAATAGMMRAIAAVTPPIECRMGAKRITLIAFALMTARGVLNARLVHLTKLLPEDTLAPDFLTQRPSRPVQALS